MPLFAIVALMPFALICLAASFGGLWVWAAVLYMTVLTATLDQAVRWVMPDAPEGAEFPAANALLVALALAHLLVFPLVVWAIAGPSGLRIGQKLLLGFAAGLWFGQVSNPCAHELIHRGNRVLYGLGVAVYASLLFGHHASAHRLVHHRFAASLDDPNTAREGETFYHFWPRAWAGSFRQGWRAEARLRVTKGGLHPYFIYLMLSLGALGVGFVVGGWVGALVWVFLALHGQTQLLLADYVQHYGLRRARLPNGKLEPVSARHSWNAPHWFSSGLMLNAPRHSDHHAHPNRPYPALRLPAKEDAPYLPYPLPVCCTLALFPRLWQRVVGRRLVKWRQLSAKQALGPQA
ncbi:alkane 1-monooxygenase (plasmid) [Pseudorhodobacter turbinis]|uniref:Alkane 1-monooxygenase n=2 Tax=Pseudorhodobacter turbinis TaxID=2500533 RepID=A0A4P8ELA2_9RHOB|nr:alkane 1-monooxygenase [Pseudorhodobacter turbinis]